VSNKIRVIAAMLDTKELTLWLPDGTTITIPQGDDRLQVIVDQVLPIVSTGGVAEIDLNCTNVYAQFEENSSGVVKFFRIAKKKLKEIFGTKTAVEPFDVQGMSPERHAELTRLANVVSQIQEHAVPASSPDFNDVADNQDENSKVDPNYEKGDTVVAIVDNESVVADAHKVRHQLSRSNNLGSTVGMENFLRRAGRVTREHSVEDLMQFMKRGDLQVADDGCIIIYKILKNGNKQAESGTFFDCHTGKVPQRVGSYVHMDETLVDHNRRTECSNGLHVARRQYLSQFSGDACVLAKVAPEDVIAVPTYDSDKMRVCGYHILFVLDEEDFRKVKKNERLTSPTALRQLGLAVSGDHVGKLESVKITQQRGGGVIITPLTEGSIAKREVQAKTQVKDSSPTVTPLDETQLNQANPVDPNEINKRVIETKQLSRKDQAAELYKAYDEAPLDQREAAYEKLYAFKKASKVGWDKLGIPDPTASPQVISEAKEILDEAHGILKPVKLPAPPKAKKPAKPKEKTVAVIEALTAPSVPAQAAKPKQTHAERIQTLLKGDKGLSYSTAASILSIKTAAKKSWKVLGVDEATAKRIVQLVNG
jgi:hypothetical protein